MAHPVKKQSRYEWIRAELMRAYSIMVDRAATEQQQGPGAGDYASVLAEVCAEAPPPPFLRAAKAAAEAAAGAAAEATTTSDLEIAAAAAVVDPMGGGLFGDSALGQLRGSGLDAEAEKVAGQQLDMILSGLAI